MKNIVKKLNKYKVPIIKINENLNNVKNQKHFEKKLKDMNSFLTEVGIPDELSNVKNSVEAVKNA
jgi:hypothetical protein